MQRYHDQRQAVEEASAVTTPSNDNVSLADLLADAEQAADGDGSSTSEQPHQFTWKVDGTIHLLLVAATAVAAMVTIGRGAPVFGHGVDWFALASGGAVTAVLGYAAADHVQRRTVPLRLLAASAAVAALLCVAFTIGAATSVVIDGQVHLETSTTAQAWRYSHDVANDMRRMAELDELLALDTPAARARSREFEPAIEEMTRLTTKYARQAENPDQLPGVEFRPVADAMASASYYGGVALERRSELLLQQDGRLLAELEAARGTFAQQLLRAGQLLPEATEIHGFTIQPTEAGFVE